jgi:hypothetical protein
VAVLYVMNKIVLLLQTGAISTRDSFFKMEKDIQDKVIPVPMQFIDEIYYP